MTAPGVRPAIARPTRTSLRPVTALALFLLDHLHASQARNRARRDLHRLLDGDRRMLDDIGVTRDAVFRELDGL